VSRSVPGSGRAKQAISRESALQRRLWRLASESLANQPIQSAPRLYVDSLNQMIDMQTTRVSALNNRVPTPILLLEVVAAAIALALLALHVAVLSRGVITVVFAAAVVTLLLYVTFDLDRPTRGTITIPTAPLVALRASMLLPPAAPAQP
jgi:Flp pilus assembly protein TadB